MRYSGAVELLLRLGVAFAFLYPPINAVIDPYSWVGYFPSFVRELGDEMVLLHVFGVIEAVIGLWILVRKNVFWPSAAAAAALLAIVVFNLGDFQVLFRDLSIAAMALALALMHRPDRNSS